jgi:centrosomal protein CEP76
VLAVSVVGGRAFVEFVGAPQDVRSTLHLDPIVALMPSLQPDAPQLQLELMLGGRRARSGIVPASADPQLYLQHRFPLPAASTATAADLLRIDERLYCSVLRVDRDGARALVGTHALEWRRALATGAASVLAELAGVGMEAAVPAGVLELQFEVVPRPRALIAEYDLGAVLAEHASSRAERERRFIVYARQWWRDYLGVREELKMRLIKVRFSVAGCCSVAYG